MGLNEKHFEMAGTLIAALRKDGEDVFADKIVVLLTEQQIDEITKELSECQEADESVKLYGKLVLQTLQAANAEAKERLGRPAQANEEGGK